MLMKKSLHVAENTHLAHEPKQADVSDFKEPTAPNVTLGIRNLPNGDNDSRQGNYKQYEPAE